VELPFGPTAVSWRVNREPIVLAVGGARAVLLQVAHPLVAAGVHDHSDYRHDPFGRGGRTIDWLLKVQFGDPETVAAQRALLRAVHERVTGVSPGGVPYRALDPDLLLWVWATLVDSFALAYRVFVAPMPAERLQRYYDESKAWAHASGVPEGAYPATWPELRAYVDGIVASELEVGPVLRDVATGLSPFLRRPVSTALRPVEAFLTGALLPPRLRAELGIAWGAPEKAAFATAARASRLGARVVPRRVRHEPARYLTTRRTPLVLRPPDALLSNRAS
jgi:uncharacterized protein (DUF2236 family)